MLFIYHNATEKYLDVNKLLFVPLLKGAHLYHYTEAHINIFNLKQATI